MESGNKLVDQGKMVLKYVLPQYLDEVTLARFKQASCFTRDAVKAYEQIWAKLLNDMAEKYDMVLTKDTEDGKYQQDDDRFYGIDKDLKSALDKKRMYRVRGSNNTFRMILNHTQVATMAELRGGWSWTDNSGYYEHIHRDDTMFTNPIPRLKSVCWYDPTIHVKNVLAGKYSVYVRHMLHNKYGIQNQLLFKIVLSKVNLGTNEETSSVELYQNGSFPPTGLKIDQFVNTFVCNIDVKDHVEDGHDLNLKVSWIHKDMGWKSGYTIDGVVLIPEGSNMDNFDMENDKDGKQPQQDPEDSGDSYSDDDSEY